MKALIKQFAKTVVPGSIQAYLRAQRALPGRVARLERQVTLLAAHHGRHAFGDRTGATTPRRVLNAHELQIYSQHGEDGILQYIFSVIGVANRRFVEFGMGDGRECNTAYLSLYYGWQGLLMDGNAERVAQARAFYTRILGEGQESVTIAEAWITVENINDLLRGHGAEGEVDLLSIDLDGIDYWVWRAIAVVNPRVVVVEYSAVLGWEQALTVPYDPKFERWKRHSSGLYAGASLAALAQLGRAKGYRLVGCNSHGVNAFFVRDDLAAVTLPAVAPAEAYFPCDDLVLGEIGPGRFREVAHLDWETV